MLSQVADGLQAATSLQGAFVFLPYGLGSCFTCHIFSFAVCRAREDSLLLMLPHRAICEQRARLAMILTMQWRVSLFQHHKSGRAYSKMHGLGAQLSPDAVLQRKSHGEVITSLPCTIY